MMWKRLGSTALEYRLLEDKKKKLNLLLIACMSGDTFKKVEKCWIGYQAYLEELSFGYFLYASWPDLCDIC